MNVGSGIVFVVSSFKIRKVMMRESMGMDTEKWGHGSFINANYSSVHQQPCSRKYSHRSGENQAMDEEVSVACHLPPPGMKERVFHYIFGESWSSQQ